MLQLIYASLATVDELFDYKSRDFKLEQFPGYSEDQWGIKAHNRPWIDSVGKFAKNHKVIEVGGAYSSLPRFLARKYDLEAWVGDDFGEYTNDKLWTRWGDPKELPLKFPETKYVFEPFGHFSDAYPTNYFDRIFSVSTLEHIPVNYRLNVFKDMNRCMANGGLQLHAIDINIPRLVKRGLYNIIGDKLTVLGKVDREFRSEITQWMAILKESGVRIATKIPNSVRLYDRGTHVESPDVVYRFYPPTNAPKTYSPTASLLIIIKKD